MDFQEDIRPLLGNEFVVGATSVSSIIDDTEDDEFVGAIRAEDGDKLREAVAGEAEESGEQNGATIYEDSDGDAFAVEGDTLVVAGSRELLDSALEQRDADDRLTEDTFEESLADLPEEALIKVYGDIGALIESDPDTEQARKVKWVGAIETLGLTASVEEDGIAVDFNLATDGDLSDEDLPIASGAESPPVANGDDEVGVALRGADQVFRFVRSTAQAIDPRQAGQIDVVLKQVESRTGVSVEDDVLGQLSGGLSAAIKLNGDSAGLRGEPEDPEAFKRTLADLAPALPDLVQAPNGRVGEITVGGGTLYRVSGSDRSPWSSACWATCSWQPRRRSARARPPRVEPRTVEGAEGALVMSANGEAIANAVLEQLGGLTGAGGQFFTGPIGDLTGSVESSTDGLRGSVRLAID